MTKKLLISCISLVWSEMLENISSSRGLLIYAIPCRKSDDHNGHLPGDAESRTAALAYLGIAPMPATWWFIRWIYATARRLPDRRRFTSYVRRLNIEVLPHRRRILGGDRPGVLELPAGLIAAGIVTLSYIVPPAKPVFRSDEGAVCRR